MSVTVTALLCAAGAVPRASAQDPGWPTSPEPTPEAPETPEGEEPSAEDTGIDPPAAAEKPRGLPDPWAYVTLGSGLVLAAGGVGLLLSAEDDSRLIRQAEADGAEGSQRAKQLREEQEKKQIAGPILLGVGGAALIGAIIWLVLDAEAAAEQAEPGTDGPTATFLPTPGGAHLSVHF